MILSLRQFKRSSRQRRPRWNGRQIALRATAAMIVLAALVFGGWRLARYVVSARDTCMSSGSTLVLHAGSSGECVGVTDGAFLFQFGSQQQGAALHRIEALILKEDQRVRASGRGYVSVVYLMPAAGAGNAESITNFTSQLEGAYTAQMAANGLNDTGADISNSGQSPLVQLLIASSGINAEQYLVTDRIIDSDVATQRVVAVDGIAISLTGTIQEVKDLAATDGIPVFGSTITADDFDNIQNMVRIAPSNKQEVDRLLNYVKATLRSRDALLVEDTNKHDAYSQTISSEFATAFPDKTHYLLPTQTYDTDPVADPTRQITSSQLSQIPLDICTSKPDIVLFGGRGKDLGTLVAYLAKRPCTTPVTIVSGDSVINTPTDTPVLDGLASGVTVYYPGEYDRGEWSARTGQVLVTGTNVYPQARAGYLAFSGEFTTLFHGARLPDADVALAYDATLTSISAIRLAGGGMNPPLSAVAQELNKLQGPHTIYGASGPIQLSGVYDQVGTAPRQGSNPVGKLVPILRLSAHGVRNFETLEQLPVPVIGG